MIIKNNIIPFKGYKVINLFGIIFTRKDLNEIDINHEKIHTAQMKEMLYLPFYLWYGLEYLIRYIISIFNDSDPYRSISLEQEAYNNDDNLCYLQSRKHYNWIKYLID